MTTTPDKLGAARLMLESLGLSPQDLLDAPDGDSGTITLREYAGAALAVLKAKKPGTHGTYHGPLAVLIDGLPDLCRCRCPACTNTAGTCSCTPDEADTDGHAPTCTGSDCAERFPGVGDVAMDRIDLNQLDTGQTWVTLRAAKRTDVYNAARAAAGRTMLERDGRGAGENYVGAVRWLFKRALTEGVVRRNLAADLAKPSRLDSPPRALTVAELDELFAVATTTGRDPELDGLLLWADLETGSRAGGLLNMTVGRLDQESSVNRTFEKKTRNRNDVPITPALTRTLIAHAIDRGPRVPAPADAAPELRRAGLPNLRGNSPLLYRRPEDTFDHDGVFLARTVHPVSAKRLDNLRARLKRHLKWADDRQLRWHDLRHTTGTMLERVAGAAVSRAQLGHTTQSTNDIYTAATLAEQAAAIARLFGTSHPLVDE